MDARDRIRKVLLKDLPAQSADVRDESASHAGHAGAGHFSVTVVSAAFRGKGPLERHRLVWSVLDAAMKDEIHALRIRAFSPEETLRGPSPASSGTE